MKQAIFLSYAAVVITTAAVILFRQGRKKQRSPIMTFKDLYADNYHQ